MCWIPLSPSVACSFTNVLRSWCCVVSVFPFRHAFTFFHCLLFFSLYYFSYFSLVLLASLLATKWSSSSHLVNRWRIIWREKKNASVTHEVLCSLDFVCSCIFCLSHLVWRRLDLVEGKRNVILCTWQLLVYCTFSLAFLKHLFFHIGSSLYLAALKNIKHVFLSLFF